MSIERPGLGVKEMNTLIHVAEDHEQMGSEVAAIASETYLETLRGAKAEMHAVSAIESTGDANIDDLLDVYEEEFAGDAEMLEAVYSAFRTTFSNEFRKEY